MLTKEDQILSFVYMGLFNTQQPWIHPKRTERDFELIYVVDGQVHMKEEERVLHLKKGDLCLLRPFLSHEGISQSTGHTSFFWVHFLSEGELKGVPGVMERFGQPSLFKELLHYSNLPNCPDYVVNAVLLHLLCSAVFSEGETESRLAKEVYEWTRVHADGSLTVEQVAKTFGYHPEHLSRLIRRQYGTGLKGLIDRFVLLKLKDRLCHTNDFVKEIAGQCGFRDASACIKFFQYHEGLSPNRYRNLYSNTHMNKE